MFKLLCAKNRRPVPSGQRSKLPLPAFSNPSTNGFNMITKNCSKLLPAGYLGLISRHDNRADFECGYFHAESLANLYRISKLKCSNWLRQGNDLNPI